jgi:RNA polymerase sigma-70 factor (ECF subfamily)
MLPDTVDFLRLLERVRQGEQAAARELFDLFEPYVRRVIRSRLPHIMRSKFDSIDFVQSVWANFFDKLHRREIDFNTPEQLVQFLKMTAQSRIATEYRRRLRSQSYNLKKEISIEQGNQHVPLISREPSPSQEAAAQERYLDIFQGRPRLHQEVLRLRGEGFTFAEIAERLDIDERSARRILHNVERELGLEEPGE